jgi:hypothetical protein
VGVDWEEWKSDGDMGGDGWDGWAARGVLLRRTLELGWRAPACLLAGPALRPAGDGDEGDPGNDALAALADTAPILMCSESFNSRMRRRDDRSQRPGSAAPLSSTPRPPLFATELEVSVPSTRGLEVVRVLTGALVRRYPGRRAGQFRDVVVWSRRRVGTRAHLSCPRLCGVAP